MKNKGFTLVELLGVLTLLALISLITVPLVSSYIKNSRQKAYNVEIKTIEKAAKQWMIKYSSEVSWVDDTFDLTINKLRKSEFLEDKDIVNPINPDKMIDGCVHIIRTDYKYTYEYKESC